MVIVTLCGQNVHSVGVTWPKVEIRGPSNFQSHVELEIRYLRDNGSLANAADTLYCLEARALGMSR